MRFAATLCLLLAANTSAATMARFPGRQSVLSSPNGLLSIVNEDSDDPRGSWGNHRLLLLDRDGKRRQIYAYDRVVGVLWSPDSSTIAVNDAQGSDFGTAVLLPAGPLGWRKDLRARVESRREAAFQLQKLHHSYVSVIRFLGQGRVELAAYGRGGALGSHESVRYIACFRYEMKRRSLAKAPCSTPALTRVRERIGE
jgi:hypothetical protein